MSRERTGHRKLTAAPQNPDNQQRELEEAKIIAATKARARRQTPEKTDTAIQRMKSKGRK